MIDIETEKKRKWKDIMCFLLFERKRPNNLANFPDVEEFVCIAEISVTVSATER